MNRAVKKKPFRDDILVQLRSWRTDDFRNAGHCPLKTGFLTRESETPKTVLTALSSPKPNYSKIALVTGIFHKKGIGIYNIQLFKKSISLSTTDAWIQAWEQL
jgi:hypothetical protein